MKVKQWLCRNNDCRAILGNVVDDELVIKRKDLYVTIIDAQRVSTNCYKCGLRNDLRSKDNPAIVELRENP